MVTKTDCNTKVTEVEGKSPDTHNLATKTALTVVENKIPSVSNFLKKSKIIEIEKKINDHNHDEYITIQKFNYLATKNFTARLKQAELVTKTTFDDKIKSLNQKINSNKTKHSLVENEINRLKQFSSEYLVAKHLFQENGVQNYLVFS